MRAFWMCRICQVLQWHRTEAARFARKHQNVHYLLRLDLWRLRVRLQRLFEEWRQIAVLVPCQPIPKLECAQLVGKQGPRVRVLVRNIPPVRA